MLPSGVRAAVKPKAFRNIQIMLGLFLWLGIQSQAYSQVLYGSIVGTITDPSGAVVPGAVVTATDIGTGQTRTDTTDQSGRYSIANLSPGTYSVVVIAKGFRKLEQSNVMVTPNTVNRSDVRVEVGQATEQVNVSAQALQLQTDKADTHTEINSKSVTTMPLGGNRNYQTLINLAPGTTPASFYNSSIDVPAQPLNTHVNGAAGQTNVTKIDGAESVNVWLPQYTGYVAPAETIDVVNVTTSAADADQGLAGASSITVVTKSGTNQIHGSAFIFDNNQHFNARNFFLQPNQAKPVAIYNNFGATIGGPIKKDKLFYFASFDGTTQKSSGNGLYTVPTQDQRNGNFSAYNTPIYNPLTGNADGTGRSVFANGIIPAQFISSAGAEDAELPPASQSSRHRQQLCGLWCSGDQSFPVRRKGQLQPDRESLDLGEIRQHVRHIGRHRHIWRGRRSRAGAEASPGKGRTSVQVASIGGTYVISPTLLLDGNVGYQRLNQSVLGTDFGTNYSAPLGIPGLNGPDIRDSGFPDVSFGGITLHQHRCAELDAAVPHR